MLILLSGGGQALSPSRKFIKMFLANTIPDILFKRYSGKYKEQIKLQITQHGNFKGDIAFLIFKRVKK
jgi:hypothetical protein